MKDRKANAGLREVKDKEAIIESPSKIGKLDSVDQK